MKSRDRLQEAALRAGWTLGRRIPRRFTSPLAWLVARAAVGVGAVDTAAWQANVARVTGQPPTAASATKAIEHYARYFLEMLTLPGWSAAELRDTVVISQEAFRDLRDDLYGPGAVLALGHLGNWDLAGAWACRHSLPVTSVAEVLPGSAFQDFLRFRERLGFRIYGHRDADVLARLVADATRHRLVCLLADRDLKRRGICVEWPTRTGVVPVTVPAGPALVAQRSGATLRALALRYAGRRMIMDFSDRIDVGPGPAGLREASQRIADHLGGAVLREPEQWHVLQPFFVEPA